MTGVGLVNIQTGKDLENLLKVKSQENLFLSLMQW